MKLVHPDLSGYILKEETYCMQWIIESPKLFQKYVRELVEQCSGNEGEFVLSKNGKEINISKNVELIVNPFVININDKRILNKLYTELEKIVESEELFFKTKAISQQMYEFLLEVEQKTRAVLDIETEFDWSSIFKAAGIKYEIEKDQNNLIEYLLKYVETLNEILKVELFIFVNLRSYLEDEELDLLLQELEYKEIYTIFIENKDRGCLKGQKYYIIDRDKCEIY